MKLTPGCFWSKPKTSKTGVFSDYIFFLKIHPPGLARRTLRGCQFKLGCLARACVCVCGRVCVLPFAVCAFAYRLQEIDCGTFAETLPKSRFRPYNNFLLPQVILCPRLSLCVHLLVLFRLQIVVRLSCKLLFV